MEEASRRRRLRAGFRVFGRDSRAKTINAPQKKVFIFLGTPHCTFGFFYPHQLLDHVWHAVAFFAPGCHQAFFFLCSDSINGGGEDKNKWEKAKVTANGENWCGPTGITTSRLLFCASSSHSASISVRLDTSCIQQATRNCGGILFH